MFNWLKNPILGAKSLREYETAVDELIGNLIFIFALLLVVLELLREPTFAGGIFVGRYAIGAAAAVLLLKNLSLPLSLRGVLFAALPTVLAAMSSVTDPYFVFVHHIFLALIIMVSVYFHSGMLVAYGIFLNFVMLLLYLFHPTGLFGNNENPGDVYFVFGLTDGIIFILFHVTRWVRELLAASLNEVENMQKLAFKDSLTGIANRASFLEQLDIDIAYAKMTGANIAVALMDIDNFKVINDTLGHEAGDHYLIETTNRIKSCIRSSDTLARLGGDEFCLILPGPGRKENIQMQLQRIIETVSRPYLFRGQEIQSSISIGIAYFPKDRQETSELIKAADTAMYSAKRRGKNCLQFYENAYNN